jgi:hypothetical protein
MGAWGYSVFENDAIMDVFDYFVDNFFTKNEIKLLIDELFKMAPKNEWLNGAINASFKLDKVDNSEDKKLINFVHKYTLALGEKEIQRRMDLISYHYDRDMYLMDIVKISFKSCLNLKCSDLEMFKYLSSMQKDFSDSFTYTEVESRKKSLIQFNLKVMNRQHFTTDEYDNILKLLNGFKANDSLVEQFYTFYEKEYLSDGLDAKKKNVKALKI